MRDVIRANGLIIAVDNSGSVGEKAQDDIRASYETVGYFSARVALMECIAAGGEPFAAVLHNFSGDEAWPDLCKGIYKAAAEVGCELELNGSSESNFTMNQSAAGIIIIGKHVRKTSTVINQPHVQFGVVGKPLVGSKVITNSSEIAPLSLFCKITELDGVSAVLPVGSKGIAWELKQLTGKSGRCRLDMDTSGGPATCFIVAANNEAFKKINQLTNLICWIEMND